MFATTPDDLDMHVIYDVSHNIAKVEEHVVDGKQKTLLVHRKGSTRAFPPHHPLIPVDYQVNVRTQTHHSVWRSFLITIMSPAADRPAGPDRRDHGNLQLCSNGDRTGHDGDVWNHMSRGGTTPDAHVYKTECIRTNETFLIVIFRAVLCHVQNLAGIWTSRMSWTD